MTTEYGELSGWNSARVVVSLEGSSYNAAENYSTWAWGITFNPNGSLAWTNNTQYWSISGFAVASGTFTIPEGMAGQDIYLASGYFNKYHDANGYLDAGTLLGAISTDHSSIGSGSVGVYSGTPPRIPKPPSAPGAPNASGIGPKSATLAWSVPTDSGGLPINAYQIQIDDQSNFSSPVVDHTRNDNVALYSTGDVLSPAVDYFARIRARNASHGQWGPWSATGTFRTRSGSYVGDSGAYVAAEISVGVGGSYVAPEIFIGSGGIFKPAG